MDAVSTDAPHPGLATPAPVPVPATEPPAVAPKPERLGSYELLLELAAGGMATVHLGRATDRREGPPLVAIKRPHRHLAAEKVFVTMLVDEARLASAIEHPNVVKVRELGFEGGMPFIVMDYVEGASLAELRRELTAMGRAIDTRVAVRIVLDALAGLHAAHVLRDDNDKPLNLVHRDVSPHNVLIGCDGRSYITDFGIAKAEDRIQVTRTHEVKGKLAYLAPERVDRRRICTVQSDVFSMAIVLWECFAGRRLFRADEAVDILQEVMSAPIPTLEAIGASVPTALDDVIARALSRDLDTRYATAQIFGEAIERAATREFVGTHADVARLIEAVFGARMAERQNQARAALGPRKLDDLLRKSGLPTRAVGPFVPGSGPLVSDLAPPAPTARYVAGTELRAALARLRLRRVPWRTIATVGGGVAVGALVTLASLGVFGRRAAAGPASPAASILASPMRSAAATPAGAAAAATVRRVVVPLPFVSARITFDDSARDLDPATDVVALDVPGTSGARHHVAAVATDGTKAEGYVVERDGIARPEGDGYAFTAPPAARDDARRPGARHGPRPAGTVRDGFTKLR